MKNLLLSVAVLSSLYSNVSEEAVPTTDQNEICVETITTIECTTAALTADTIEFPTWALIGEE